VFIVVNQPKVGQAKLDVYGVFYYHWDAEEFITKNLAANGRPTYTLKVVDPILDYQHSRFSETDTTAPKFLDRVKRLFKHA